MWGGPAYFEDASSNQYVVYGCGPLVIYKLGLTPNVTLTQAGSANTGGLGGRDSGSQPVISSNGTKAGTAIAWVLSTPGNGGGGITLIAVNLLNPTQSANGCSYNNCIFKGAVTPPATTLTASAASGATTFTLASLTGIAAGTTISINDSNSEQLLVQSVNPSSNTITTATPSGSAHSSGAGANVVAWSQTPGAAWIGEALVSILVANGTVYVPMDNGVAVFGLK